MNLETVEMLNELEADAFSEVMFIRGILRGFR